MTTNLPFKCVHFVGIGGIGMSAVAEMVQALGIQVQGSDKTENDNIKRLRQKGIEVFIGQKEENLKNADVVVYSTATKDNIEVKTAAQQGLTIAHRSEMLAELLKLKHSICVAGTHGKTTTSSLIASILMEANFNPSFIIGGILNSEHSNAQMGSGDWVVAEADESDGSFLRLPSTISVVTNIDPEHMDFYKTFDREKNAFLTMLNQTAFYGVNVVCLDHPVIRELLPQIKNRPLITYGLSLLADVFAEHIEIVPTGTRFDVTATIKQKQIKIEQVCLNMMGEHNVQNALAAISVALHLGISPEIIKQALANFQGIQRRLTHRGTFMNCDIYDDYAHHPNEIKATLAAIKPHVKGRLIAIWQPHRWTRFHDLYFDFLNAFDRADEVIVTDVYAAGEQQNEGPTPDMFSEKLALTKPTHFSSFENLKEMLQNTLQANDTVVCLGAGSISAFAKELTKGEN